MMLGLAWSELASSFGFDLLNIWRIESFSSGLAAPSAERSFSPCPCS